MTATARPEVGDPRRRMGPMGPATDLGPCLPRRRTPGWLHTARRAPGGALLALAIAAHVIATGALRLSNGLTRLGRSIVVAAGYASAAPKGIR